MANYTATNPVMKVVIKSEPNDTTSEHTRTPGNQPFEEMKDEPRVTDEDKKVLDTFENQNTKQSTVWAVIQWSLWRERKRKNAEEKSSVTDIPSLAQLMRIPRDQIDDYLADFITGLKRLDGKEYPEETITALVTSLQRYSKVYAEVHQMEYPAINTLIGRGVAFHFPKFSNAYLSKMDVIRNSEALPKQITEVITEQQEMELWEKGLLGINSAQTLSDTMLFYVPAVFGFVSRQALSALKVDHFTFGDDERGKYVEISKQLVDENNVALFARSNGIELPGQRLRQYRDPGNPRSFYNILQFYLGKVHPPEMPPPTRLYIFLRPLKGYEFMKQRIGVHSLNKSIIQLMEKIGVGGKFNNQSLMRLVSSKFNSNGVTVTRGKLLDIETRLKICKVLDPPRGPLFVNIETPQQPEMAFQYMARFTGQQSQIPSHYMSGIAGQRIEMPTTYIPGISGHQAEIPTQHTSMPVFSGPPVAKIETMWDNNYSTDSAEETSSSTQGVLYSNPSNDYLSSHQDHRGSQSNSSLTVKKEPLVYTDNVYEQGFETSLNYDHAETGEFEVNTKNTMPDSKRHLNESPTVMNDNKRVKLDVSNMDNDIQHTVKLESGYNTDLKRNTVKQDMTITDDDQTVYAICETNKRENLTNDLNLNLGDYIPEDCLISPRDIQIQRINTADGQKITIRMQYRNQIIEI